MDIGMFWVNLDNLDFSEGSLVKKLALTDGETSVQFHPAEPHDFPECN